MALEVFLEFEAPDYTAEGVEEFRETLRNPDYIGNLCYYVAFEENEIVGMLEENSDEPNSSSKSKYDSKDQKTRKEI